MRATRSSVAKCDARKALAARCSEVRMLSPPCLTGSLAWCHDSFLISTFVMLERDFLIDSSMALIAGTCKQ